MIVRANVPDVNGVGVPAADLALVALPYDRDSVIASLEGRAPSPRPATALLDSAFAEFRAPFAAFSSASYAAAALQDSIRAASGDPARAVQLQRSLAERNAEIATLRPVLAAARLRLAARTDAARLSTRAWEDTAFADYDTSVKSLTRFHNPLADTTDAVGIGTFEITGGTWWVTARAWDAADPNAEWYWNVKVTGDTVVLSPENARRLPRY